MSDRLKSTAIVALSLSGITVLLWGAPVEWSFVPGCPFALISGLLCPGCGSIRAWHALIQMDVSQALAFNPYAVLIAPVLALWLLWHSIRAVTGRRMPQPFIRPWILWTFLALLTVFTVARNIPAENMEILRPGNTTNLNTETDDREASG